MAKPSRRYNSSLYVERFKSKSMICIIYSEYYEYNLKVNNKVSLKSGAGLRDIKRVPSSVFNKCRISHMMGTRNLLAPEFYQPVIEFRNGMFDLIWFYRRHFHRWNILFSGLRGVGGVWFSLSVASMRQFWAKAARIFFFFGSFMISFRN